MPNYLPNISWEWEDESQKSTGRERRKRAPEKCEVYMYLSQRPKSQTVSDKKRDKGENTMNVQKNWILRVYPPLLAFFFPPGINPAKGTAEKKLLTLPAGILKQAS